MNNIDKKDKINAELSRAFFGTTKKPNTEPTKPQKVQTKSTAPNSKPVKKFPIGFIFVFILIFAIIFGFTNIKNLLKNKKIVFNFSINIEQSSAPESEPVKNVTPEPKPVQKEIAEENTPSKINIQKPAIDPDYKTLYNFEENDEGWEIPAWALDKKDHVAVDLRETNEISSKDSGSIKILGIFPGKNWTAALIEIQQYLDLSKYEYIAVDIYAPRETPGGLRAKIILTSGDTWRFIEMARSVRLSPGKWTTITAKISGDSNDWRGTKFTKKLREDIRKISIRIESNKTQYSGPIYIDNVRVK